MPIFSFKDLHSGKRIVIEAKSETAARVYLTMDYECKIVKAAELAALVLDGVAVESANKQQEAEQAELRG